MIVTSLDVLGFAKLSGRRFDFAPGLNIVYGPNESGKSTLANAIIASLYGAERKKNAWRPWNGAPFVTTLTYVLADGERIEVHRDFDRDGKGLQIFDRGGNEISAKLGGSRVVPGEAHLGVPLDVFVNAACVKQQAVAIEEGKSAAPIAIHLARALDGGPREDAALGALGRLDDALRKYVGTERSRKATPLDQLRTRSQEQRAICDVARRRLADLDELRDRLEHAVHERERLTSAAAELERREQSLRAGAIAKRLANLHAYRTELAELHAAYAAYADVADFPATAERDVDEAFHTAQAAARAAAIATADAHAARLSANEEAELDRRRRDAGALDEAAFAALTQAHEAADAARVQAVAAGRDAAEARRDDGDGARDEVGLRSAWTLSIVALGIAIGFAIAHRWTWTSLAVALVLVGIGAVATVRRRRSARAAIVRDRQRLADEMHRAYAAATDTVDAVLRPLGATTFAELAAHRARLSELLARQRAADASADRASDAHAALTIANERFDRLVAAVLPDHGALDRDEQRAAISARAARRRERDGIAAHLHGLEMRRSTIIGDDDEYALESELSDLRRGGVEIADDAPAGALRAVENERRSIAEQVRAARDRCERVSGEITATQATIPDLAILDEELADMLARIARLEAFERAVSLARSTLEIRTRQAHQAFARRLEDDASRTLSAITGGRYAEIFVDAESLAIRVRVPETNSIKGLESLSAGTRDQAYLVVRFAMARLFADGLETPPLLLDDPFAYWDADRIERCLPVIEHGAHDAQAILFTASRALADAAERRGAHRLDLPAPALLGAR